MIQYAAKGQTNARWESRDLAWIGLVLIGLFTAISAFDIRVALLGALATIAVTIAIARPTIAIFLMAVLFYSNVAVVGVKFHNLPFVAGAAVPFLLLIPMLASVRKGNSLFVSDSAQPFILGFFAVQVAGAAFARDSAIVKSELVDMVVEGLLIYLLVIHAIRDRQSLRALTWGLLLGGVLMSVIPIWQQLTGTSENIYGGLGQTSDRAFDVGSGSGGQFRLAGTIGEQNRFSQILLMLVPLGVLRAFTEDRRRWRSLALLSTLIVAVGSTLAFSRGTAVAFGIVIVFMILMKVIRARHIAVMGLGTAVLLAIFPQYLLRIASIPDVVGILSQENRETYQPDGAIRGRATSMLAAARVFLDHPLVGAGPGMFKPLSREYGNKGGFRRFEENREAHNLYLQIAAEEGALGLLCFNGMFLAIGLGLIRVRRLWARSDPDLASYGSAYLLALIAYQATGLFLHMSYIRYFWLIIGAATAVLVVSKAQELRWKREGRIIS